MKAGDEIEVEIIRVMDDGRGVGFDDEGKSIIVSGVKEDDIYIKAKITHVFEESRFAEKIGQSRKSQERAVKRTDVQPNPYEMDDDEED